MLANPIEIAAAEIVKAATAKLLAYEAGQGITFRWGDRFIVRKTAQGQWTAEDINLRVVVETANGRKKWNSLEDLYAECLVRNGGTFE